MTGRRIYGAAPAFASICYSRAALVSSCRIAQNGGMNYKWIGIVAIVVVALLAGFRHVAVRTWVEQRIAAYTTGDIDLDEIHWDLGRSTIHIKGLRFQNPDGFGTDVALDINLLSITYRWSSLWGNAAYPRVILDVDRVLFVKNERGVHNFEVLFGAEAAREDSRAVRSGTEDDGAAQESDAVSSVKERAWFVEQFVVRLAEVDVIDYQRNKDTPFRATYRLNSEQTLTHISGLTDLARRLTDELAFFLPADWSEEWDPL